MATPATRENQSDLELAGAILARDRKATARLVELHTDSVYRYVWRRMTPKVDMVDDVVQETFIAAWGSMRTYSGEASLRTWLMGIARNKVEDHYRRTLKQSLIDLESEPDQPMVAAFDIERELDANRQAKRAAGVLAELPYEYSAALRWRYWDGRSAREMAAATGKTEKAVERLLARAREQFKTRWLETKGASDG